MTERESIQDVNIELGDDISRMLYQASLLTHENRPGLLVEFHPSFSGLRAIPASYLKNLDSTYLNIGFDGVGTKVEVSERLDDHSVVAHDLFAMICDDAVVRGAEPVAVGTILDVRHLGDPDDPDSIDHARNAVQQLATGYVEAAREAGVVVVNGEVAELGDRVGGYGGHAHNFNYNWGGTVLWFADRDRLLTGQEIQPGDALIGLVERGFRSNGITDVRKALLERYGENWHELVIRRFGAVSMGRLVQRPSTIYSRLIMELTGGFDTNKEPKAKITGVAHITGGGQPSKLGRMLEPSGLGVVIDDPVEPNPLMLEVQSLRGYSDKKAYGKWNMGVGMIVVAPESEADTIIDEARAQGKVAKVIGAVIQKSGIKIKNMAAIQNSKWLNF